MEKQKIMQAIYDGIVALDKVKVLEMTNVVINENLDIKEVIDQSMTPALQKVGAKFQCGDMFLPELQMSAEVFTAAMDILQPEILKSKAELELKGRVVIGTVKGDLHSIGKDLVVTMLKTAGFEVTDLGVDVPTFTFLEEAERVNAGIIALSALLTTTMPAQREVIEALNSQGVREKYKVMIGGAPVNENWAKEIGADSYGADAAKAMTLAKELYDSFA